MLFAELFQQGEIAGPPGAEAEVVTHQHVAGLQAVHQDALDEILGGQGCEGLAEPAHMHMGHPQAAQDFQLFPQGSEAGGG